MLGLSRKSNTWQWNAVGKHPAAADYINVKGGTPLMEAVGDWMTKGYHELLQEDRASGQETHSWRFWLRGAKKGRIICGLGRDSSDRIGRPFPLLIIGEGELKGWEKSWEALPSGLNLTWERIERMASQRYDDLKALVRAIDAIVPPNDANADSAIEGISPDQGVLGDRFSACRDDLAKTGRALIPLNAGGSDPAVAAAQWHARLKACCPDIPRAVFLGGTPQRTYLAVIQQPLSTADFMRLWRVR
ncbi:MAG: type VI secretion system-associated protein TagF [Desulfatitalea sp.]|nr:type VI secretion system-associated protein TagF [Desulfatitalea sp.]NNK00412.1 type VI secretion system-associated protein TagF [Desulfatitalea sp.]